MLPKVSSTFHGRDVFAPAAAHLDMGVKPSEFGPEITDAVNPEFASLKRRNGSLIGEVLHVDSFGNIITNISQKEIAQAKTINVKLQNLSLNLTFGKTYAQAKPQEPIALIGSHGFLEIALNQDSAAEKFHVKAGDKIEVTNQLLKFLCFPQLSRLHQQGSLILQVSLLRQIFCPDTSWRTQEFSARLL